MKRKLYGAILADPPWRFDDVGTRLAPSYAGDAREEKRYDVMRNSDILDLGWWVQALCKPDAFLLLWCPNALVLEGLATKTARAWGFEPRQLVPWVKTSANGRPRLGGGHYTRVCTEQLVLCRRGNAKVKRRDEAGVIIANRRGHSEKPLESHEMIERICNGPFLELFARRRFSKKWDVWGNEAPEPIPGPFHSWP
jgi:N6-adenosine-specific RNA methylase IME4